MVSQVSLLGVTFHLYGLVLGIAILIALHIFTVGVKRRFPSVTEDQLLIPTLVVLISGVIGARVWHVLTDFWLYQSEPVAILYIWNGGLSIFGALLGGGIALWCVHKKWLSKIPVVALFDLLAVSIPFGQSIGRWANFINQELYGAPTEAWWAIFIERQFRLPGYEHVERFHPLFLYESLAMAVFGSWLWLQQKKRTIGSGYFIAVYVGFYASLRFLLDFLRIGVPRGPLMLSANQGVLFCVLVVLVVCISKKHMFNKTTHTTGKSLHA